MKLYKQKQNSLEKFLIYIFIFIQNYTLYF